MLVTVGGPENWKDKMAGGLDGTVAVLCTANRIGRGDWIRNAFEGWQSIVLPRKNLQERTSILVEPLAISPIVNFDASQGNRTTACRNGE